MPILGLNGEIEIVFHGSNCWDLFIDMSLCFSVTKDRIRLSDYECGESISVIWM